MILNTSITNHQPEAPAFTGIVHKYNVKNNSRRGPIKVTTGSDEALTVNGVSVPRSATIPIGAKGTIYSPIATFGLDTPLSGGALNVNFYYLSLSETFTRSRTTEGYLMIEREVVVNM